MSVDNVLEKPAVGLISAFGGSVMSFFEIGGVIIGFLAGCIGILVGFYTLRIKILQYREMKKNKK